MEVTTNNNIGESSRLTRLMLHLRQVDISSLAKVPTVSVTALEKNRPLPFMHKKRILDCLNKLKKDYPQKIFQNQPTIDGLSEEEN
jgi:hypothetical protein